MLNTFTAHNIRLDDGAETMPGAMLVEDQVWFAAARRALQMVFPLGFRGRRIVDLGCLEGGYSVAFARMGFETLGIEVRKSNYDNCLAVKARVDLPNLSFAQDDVANLERYGRFDAVFCCGLLYHLDNPGSFIRKVGAVCDKVALFQTHFAPSAGESGKFNLSELTEREGLSGRWCREHGLAPGEQLEKLKWASWENQSSFWLEKPSLLAAINNAGFPLVFEQYDNLLPDIPKAMGPGGYYSTDFRSLFVGVKI